MSLPIKQLNLPDLSQGIPQNKASGLYLILFAESNDQHQRRGRHVHGLGGFRPDRSLIAFTGREPFDRMAMPIPDILPLPTFA